MTDSSWATAAPEAQGARQPRGDAPGPAVWAAGWGAALALALWLAQLLAPWLLLAGVGAAVWSWGAARRSSRLLLVTAGLWVAVGIAGGVQYRLWEVARQWPELEASIEEGAAAALNVELDRLVERGERAVGEAAAAAADRAPFTRLEEVRAATAVSALAVYGPDGAPLAWAGEHRGVVPPGVQRGEHRYWFQQGPLFSYVYFTLPLQGRRTAVAAVLLESDLAADDRISSFAHRFREAHGLTPRFSPPERARGETIWDWCTDRCILSVSFGALTQQGWWERVMERGRWAVGAALLLSLALLCLAWYRARMPAPGVPVGVITAVLLAAPLGEMLAAQELFSPLRFVLPPPLPWDVTLGMLLVLLTGTAVWLLIRLGGARESPGALPWWAAAVGAAAVVPAVLWTVERSAVDGLLAANLGGGLGLQLATTLLLTIPLFVLLHHVRGRTGRARSPVLAAGAVLAVALGTGWLVAWRPSQPVPAWAGAAWALPVALIALGLPAAPARRRALRSWLVAGGVALSAALPSLWVMHVQAKLESAERELARLGTEADPFLDFLLHLFAEKAVYFAREGEEGINLLYHSWVDSGLAREGYEARLTIWNRGRPEAELGLSGTPSDPEVIRQALARAAGSDDPSVARFTQVPGLHYLLLVPLPEGRMASVAVPPRSRLGRATALARFLQPATDDDGLGSLESLYLVPSAQAGAAGTAHAAIPTDAAVLWLRTETGWRSEAAAHFPSGWMHAHLFVRTSSLPLLLTRAILAGVVLLAALLTLWGMARLIRGEIPAPPTLRSGWLGTFRGRLTVALFAFFLLPTTAFAVAAYQAVSREVVRSAAGVALRALDQTVTNIARLPLADVSRQVGLDLLMYRRGELRDAAAPEVLDLGLFHTWLPPQLYGAFASGENLEDWEIRHLGENDYLVAYRRYDPTTVFAAPVPLASEEISRRQTEFRDIALLMGLLGAGLSVVLALLVGRALTRPLDQLSRAAASIGAGNLRVRLAEERSDEFGSVYRSFNRMARRLRRARTALEQETRRTETIVTEAATGVLALDAGGRVELVNPRAAEILGAPLNVGEPLPTSNPRLAAVAEAVRRFRRSGEAEAGEELEIDDRIVRLRLRRLSPVGGPRGAVVALEDVTSEIRTARVLAWGEMARQVAHEIKNPLTPIKLAVQHVRRAFQDGRPDFRDILDRNVDAVLAEIDRLGEIARAFARFGTPQAAEALEPVDVVRAVEETLALYRGTGGDVRYRAELDSAQGVRAVARMGELKEVLVNLLENAREALNGEGEILIRVSRPPEPGWVDVDVADTGEGIPAELLPRIFEPRFSTRTSGTGLGLAIVRRLVESWGGEATAESEPGSGARVRIRLRTVDELPR